MPRPPSSEASAVTIRTVADQAQLVVQIVLTAYTTRPRAPVVATATNPGEAPRTGAEANCPGESRSVRAASAVPISHATIPGSGAFFMTVP